MRLCVYLHSHALPPTPARDVAFKLRPIKMSGMLVRQLVAIDSALGKQALLLQAQIKDKKSKKRHYKPILEEARSADLYVDAVTCFD